MKRVFLFTVIMLVYSSVCFSQFKTTPLFTTGDQMPLEVTSSGDYYYYHTIEKGQTLYALSKTFGYSLTKLKAINGKSSTAVNLHERIKIPIEKEGIFTGTSISSMKYGTYIPVVYEAKPKDNLYRVAKVYFNQAISDVVLRNRLESQNIDVGQKIILGWYPLEKEIEEYQNTNIKEAIPTAQTDSNPISSTTTTVTTTTLNNPQAELITNESVDSQLVTIPEDFNVALLGSATYSKDMKYTEKKEVATWDKNVPDNGQIYVLHNQAIIDTYIELYNPLVKRSVRAKVIGKIPFGAYTSEVKLIISPKAAEALGALDSRIRVDMKYYK